MIEYGCESYITFYGRIDYRLGLKQNVQNNIEFQLTASSFLQSIQV